MHQNNLRKLLSAGSLLLAIAFSVACCPNSRASQPGRYDPAETTIPEGARYDQATRDYVYGNSESATRYHKNCDGSTTVSGTNTKGQPYSYYN
jgi:hypothetical protein